MPFKAMDELETCIFHPDAHGGVWLARMSRHDKRRLLIYPWVSSTLETPQTRQALWSRLYHEYQVDGLCTNYPLELQAWITEQRT